MLTRAFSWRALGKTEANLIRLDLRYDDSIAAILRTHRPSVQWVARVLLPMELWRVRPRIIIEIL
jgi:hypothetical protein